MGMLAARRGHAHVLELLLDKGLASVDEASVRVLACMRVPPRLLFVLHGAPALLLCAWRMQLGNVVTGEGEREGRVVAGD